MTSSYSLLSRFTAILISSHSCLEWQYTPQAFPFHPLRVTSPPPPLPFRGTVAQLLPIRPQLLYIFCVNSTGYVPAFPHACTTRVNQIISLCSSYRYRPNSPALRHGSTVMSAWGVHQVLDINHTLSSLVLIGGPTAFRHFPTFSYFMITSLHRARAWIHTEEERREGKKRIFHPTMSNIAGCITVLLLKVTAKYIGWRWG